MNKKVFRIFAYMMLILILPMVISDAMGSYLVDKLGRPQAFTWVSEHWFAWHGAKYVVCYLVSFPLAYRMVEKIHQAERWLLSEQRRVLQRDVEIANEKLEMAMDFPTYMRRDNSQRLVEAEVNKENRENLLVDFEKSSAGFAVIVELIRKHLVNIDPARPVKKEYLQDELISICKAKNVDCGQRKAQAIINLLYPDK